MQKLKNSLENNILKTFLKKEILIFNIEMGSNINIKNSHLIYVTKTLTTNSSRQLKFLCNLETYDLKYPIVLKIFENNQNIKQYFDSLEGTTRESNVVATKLLNKIFKNNSYSIIKNVNSTETFLKFENTLNQSINLLRILKLKFTKTKL